MISLEKSTFNSAFIFIHDILLIILLASMFNIQEIFIYESISIKKNYMNANIMSTQTFLLIKHDLRVIQGHKRSLFNH